MQLDKLFNGNVLMNGWENTEKIVKFYHSVFPPATFVFRNDPIHQQCDIIC